MSRRKKAKRSVWRWLLPTLLLVVLLLFLGGAGTLLYLSQQNRHIPLPGSESAMPADGVLTLTELDDDSFRLEWPEGDNADFYLVEILDKNGQLLRSSTVAEGTACILRHLDRELTLTLRVCPARYYRLPGSDGYRLGTHCLSYTGNLTPPRIHDLSRTVDPDQDTAQLEFRLDPNTYCKLFSYTQDGTVRQLQTLHTPAYTLTFGENGNFPMPEVGDPALFGFQVFLETPSLHFCSQIVQEVSVTREELRDSTLRVIRTLTQDNACTFRWNETQGEQYVLQVMEQGQTEWTNLYTGTQEDPLEYTIPRLKNFWEYRFRLLALDADGQEAIPPSEEISFRTDPSPVWCSMWTLKELPIYRSASLVSQVVGTAAAGEAFCILAQEGDFFRIRHGSESGWLESNYCMINLPEYLGTLCAYNITNSTKSLYRIHDLDIPEVTDKVIAGYERVQLADGSYLVPLLYPAALKLKDAALAAWEQGYRLKIYDSFRPWKATQSIYELTEKILQDPIPADQLMLLEEKELKYYFPNGIDFSAIPDATDPTQTTDPSDPSAPTEPAGPVLTYQQLMTDNNRYALANFLASQISNHNRGIALDLTLERRDTGEELEAQTAMHDLSWYSEPKQNKENANLLKAIMTGAGMGGLDSEWWHFQDNDAKYGLALEPLWGGVRAACWMADPEGWRYRQTNGTYCIDCTVEIGGVSYAFDENGFLKE